MDAPAAPESPMARAINAHDNIDPSGDLDPYGSDHVVGNDDGTAYGDFAVVALPDGGIVVAWSAMLYVETTGYDRSLAAPETVVVTGADDPRLPYGLPMQWRKWADEAGDAEAATVRWDAALRATIEGVLETPDCEGCGAAHDGQEWEITSRRLCYDCASSSNTNVPQEWHIEGV